LWVTNYVGAQLPIFGEDYQTAVDASESSTTLAAYQQKLRLTTASLAAGTYRVGFSMDYSSDDENEPMLLRCQVDDSTTIGEASPVQKKKLADGAYNNWASFNQIALAAGVHTIDLDFANSNAKTTYVKNARIEIWRVL
jgi:hypothetical protein